MLFTRVLNMVLTHTQVIIGRLNNTPLTSLELLIFQGDLVQENANLRGLCMRHPQYFLTTWRRVNTNSKIHIK